MLSHVFTSNAKTHLTCCEGTELATQPAKANEIALTA